MIKIPKKRVLTSILFLCIYFVGSVLFCCFMPLKKNVILFYMLIGYISLFFGYMCNYSEFNNKGRRRAILLIFVSIFIIAFLVCFRGNNTAIDDRTYYKMYNILLHTNSIDYFLSSFLEPGFLILYSFLIFIFKDYSLVQVVMGGIPFVIIAISLLKLRERVDVTIILYLFFTSFYFQMLSVNLERMFFAVSLVMFSITYLLEGDIKNYSIVIAIATLFHFSAIFMMILVYMIILKNDKNIKKITYAAYICVPLLFYFAIRYIVPLMGARHMQYLEISKFSISDIVDKLDKLPLLILYLYYKQFVNYKICSKKEIKMFEYILGFSIVIGLSGLFFSFGRLIYYLDVYMAVGFAMITKNMKEENKRRELIALLCVYGLLVLFVKQFNVTSHATVLFPYTNVFFTIQ